MSVVPYGSRVTRHRMASAALCSLCAAAPSGLSRSRSYHSRSNFELDPSVAASTLRPLGDQNRLLHDLFSENVLSERKSPLRWS